ncbi:hypothetical protein MMC22_005270 [Lobaria immixta]|nr:hypothetical protein [Lobaria immixta]
MPGSPIAGQKDVPVYPLRYVKNIPADISATPSPNHPSLYDRVSFYSTGGDICERVKLASSVLVLLFVRRHWVGRLPGIEALQIELLYGVIKDWTKVVERDVDDRRELVFDTLALFKAHVEVDAQQVYTSIDVIRAHMFRIYDEKESLEKERRDYTAGQKATINGVPSNECALL